MATPASTAAEFGAARLSEAGSAGVGCAPIYMGYEWTEKEEGAFEVEAVIGKVWPTGRRPTQTRARGAVGPRRRPSPHRVAGAGTPTRQGVV
eukprot:4559712-Pleurochrysis_carterae.AAC.1